MWIKKMRIAWAFVFGLKIIFLLLVLRFGAITFLYTTQTFYNHVYLEQYTSSTTFINEYKSDLELIPKNEKNFEKYLDRFKNKMELLSKEVIKQITIFVVTTILFPLIFLWFFMFLIRFIYGLKFDSDRIVALLNKKEIG
jgi:hypothetical protein